jgi:hypothetical protein
MTPLPPRLRAAIQTLVLYTAADVRGIFEAISSGRGFVAERDEFTGKCREKKQFQGAIEGVASK